MLFVSRSQYVTSGPFVCFSLMCLCCARSSPESAPLSSTLIDDWRFVTGDIDASDLEAALQEMGAPRISLTDLTSTRLLSPWSPNTPSWILGLRKQVIELLACMKTITSLCAGVDYSENKCIFSDCLKCL